MPDFIYTMKDLRKVVPPKREILKGIWLSFYHGAKIGVLGSNGAGKSSLLKIMAGIDQDYLGEAFLGKGYTVGYLAQEPQLDPAKTVAGNVADGVAEKMAVKRRWDEISAKFAEPMDDDEMNKLIEEQGKLQDQMDAGNLWDLDRQLEIAMALAGEPGVLLLDEPMAGMGPDESQRMVELLQSLRGATSILLVEHDMDAVFRLADTISVLVSGRVVATGNAAQIKNDAAVQHAYLGDA